MKNLKLVETAEEAVQNEYTTIYSVKGEGGVTIKGGETPNDPYQYYITYNVTSTTAPTTLYATMYGTQKYITAMSIDGGEDVTPSGTTTFNTTGEHVVAYKVNEEFDDVMAPLFIWGIKVKIGKGLKHIWYYGFQNNSELSAVTVGNVDYTSTKELYQALAKNGTGAQMAFSGTKLTQNYEVPSITSGDYIDLGLSVKWASCNLGASSPTDYGRYYQWGDTVGYEGDEAIAHSTWKSAPFNNGSSSYNESYFANVKDTVCPNGVLASQYDAVYQATNGTAHMPTKEQYSELLFGSVGEYTTVNGVNGVMLTSIKDNSKSIFIPFAGCAYDGSFSYQGGHGYVWSSSLYSNPYTALKLDLSRGNVNVSNHYRYYGFSVRGVLE